MARFGRVGLKAFRLVACLVTCLLAILATTTNFPPKTFGEFLAYAKEHPGKVLYGSAGIGSYQQINTEILAKRLSLDLLHIPFKGGGAEIIRDLANGETLHKAFLNAMTVPEMQEAFARGGMVVPRKSSLDDARGWLRDEMASWKRDVEDLRIVVED
jgi:hypothetical protein